MIKVGCIVKTKNKEGRDVLPAVVTKVNKELGSNEKAAGVDVLFADGAHGYRTIKKVTETGRHIEIQSVLDSVK